MSQRLAYLNARTGQAGRPFGMQPADQPRTYRIGGDVKQVATYTVSSASDAVYTLEIQPQGQSVVTVTFNEGATGTTSTKATGLANAINANSSLSPYVVARASSATVIVTSREGGVGFTATESDAKMTLAQTTANVGAPLVPFGVAAVRVAGQPEQAMAPDEAKATAMVWTVTPGGTVTNNEVYTVVIVGDLNCDGEEEVYTIPYQDASATAQRLVEGLAAAINTSMPANSVNATEDNSVLILTAEIAGLPFRVTCSVTDDAGAAATGTLTPAITTANVTHEFLGVVCAADIPETALSSGVPLAQYDKSRGHLLPVASKGLRYVRLDADVTSIAYGDPVLYRVNDDGSNEVNGSFRNAKSTSDAFPLPKSRARWYDGQIYTDIDGHSVAVLELL